MTVIKSLTSGSAFKKLHLFYRSRHSVRAEGRFFAHNNSLNSHYTINLSTGATVLCTSLLRILCLVVIKHSQYTEIWSSGGTQTLTTQCPENIHSAVSHKVLMYCTLIIYFDRISLYLLSSRQANGCRILRSHKSSRSYSSYFDVVKLLCNNNDC